MKELTFADFVKLDGYMTFKNDKFEICLEPCLNGCDVAIYDLEQNLLEPKKCTDLKHVNNDELLVRAYEFFNEFYNKYL